MTSTDRNAETTDAEVAKAEDAGAVGHHNSIHVVTVDSKMNEYFVYRCMQTDLCLH